MATQKSTVALDDVLRRNLSASLPTGEGQRLNPTPHGALVEHAMKCARIETKQLAAAMGITESLLLRGFKDQESISWQRVQQAGVEYPRFGRWLLIVQAADRDGVRLRIGIEIDEEVA